jgi:dihydroneopterin aldolase
MAPMQTSAPKADPSPRRVERLRLFMKGLTVQAQIGLYARERGRRQPLVIDVEVEVEPRSVHATEDTLNYERFAAEARALADSGHIDLVETFAERLANRLLDHPLVLSVTVRVEKPGARDGAAEVGVEICVAKA